jgi:short subunit dehydrogenase-like uncharacterized protein
MRARWINGSTTGEAMSSRSEFDVIIFGATGYTGRLVAEHFSRNYRDASKLRWALGGRSPERLASVASETDAPPDTALVVADTSDPAAVLAMVERTRLVITTAGPYQTYGSGLLAACAQSGTDYLDLCGEPAWMHDMINEHDEQAKASGARILFSCGFDSLPSELGVWFCEEVAKNRLGSAVPRVKGRVRAFVGGVSGGSVTTMRASVAAAKGDPAVARLVQDPFCLTPGFSGPPQPDAMTAADDPDVGPVVPFMLGATDSMNVHRSNYLMGQPYGADFVYDEMLVGSPDQIPTGPPPSELPKPGEGPTRETRESGSFDLLFIGIALEGQQVRVSVKGDRDPGYGSTSKMISETALCLLDAADVAGGIWTPAAALQQRLIQRLQAKAGLTFTDESDSDLPI